MEANLASTKSELLLNSETALQTLEARMKIKDNDIKKELFDNIIDLEQNSKAAIQNLEDDLTQTRNGFKNNFINFEGTLKAQYKRTLIIRKKRGNAFQPFLVLQRNTDLVHAKRKKERSKFSCWFIDGMSQQNLMTQITLIYIISKCT